MGLGLSIGAGMYTYLAFRPFTAVVVLLTLFLILQTHWKKNLRNAGLFLSIVFIATMPLISYYLISPQSLSARENQISIFSQHYSSSEFAKELWGNMHRTAVLPFFAFPNPDPDSPPVSGDPNPSHNPASAAMFDLTTVLLALVGLIYLFRKNRFLFWVLLLMLIPPYISEIFTIERIPESHYYGYGHPNALRVSGFIWVVLLAATSGLYWAYDKWGKRYKANTLTLVGIVAVILSIWNWHLYFNQMQVSQAFYLYNYKFNHGRTILTAGYLNKVNGQKISLTKDLDDGYVQFFLRRPAEISSFELTSKDIAMKAIKESDITAIGLTLESIPIINQLNQNEIESLGYNIQVLNNPFGQPNIYVFEKTPSLFLPQPL